MSRFSRFVTTIFLTIAGAAGFGLVTSCNIAGTSSGGTGNLKLLMTDAPTDDWTEITVHFLSASLHRQSGGAWEDFWTADTADPASGKVNLIDLSGITDIFNAADVKAGTYDRLKLVLNTSPEPDSMNLVTAEGAVILPQDITVIDPSGTGEIVVDLDPRLVVEAGENNLVGIDFDLAHPLSIVNLDGKVVISLKVRHRVLPRNLNRIQFARTLGDITDAAANPDGTATFTVENFQGAAIEFNANGLTIYTDVTAGTGAAGNFGGLLALAGSGAALVASNMNADGSLYARRVWYAGSIDKLPQFTPEGLVRRVGDYWLSIQGKKAEALSARRHRCHWDAETIFVNAETAWLFQGADMGVQGVEGLRYVARGFRVEVVAVDENVTPKIARSINIQFAHAEGIVTEPALEGFMLGWSWRARRMTYSEVSGREFGWWFYGLDSARSPDPQTLVDTAAAAREARLWVFAWAGLAWDSAGTRWVVEDLVLAPMKLHELSKITQGYGTVEGHPEAITVSTYNGWDRTTPELLTIKLDHDAEDAIQTIVGSFIWRADTNVVTFTLPVLPDRWDELLTPAVDKVRIWVHPVQEEGGAFEWHAYSVLVYQFIR
jgi:hypothetical protein